MTKLTSPAAATSPLPDTAGLVLVCAARISDLTCSGRLAGAGGWGLGGWHWHWHGHGWAWMDGHGWMDGMDMGSLRVGLFGPGARLLTHGGKSKWGNIKPLRVRTTYEILN